MLRLEVNISGAEQALAAVGRTLDAADDRAALHLAMAMGVELAQTARQTPAPGGTDRKSIHEKRICPWVPPPPTISCERSQRGFTLFSKGLARSPFANIRPGSVAVQGTGAVRSRSQSARVTPRKM